MRRTPGALSSRDRETPYLLKVKYKFNVNSGSAWVYTFLVVVIYSVYEVRLDLSGDALFFCVARRKIMTTTVTLMNVMQEKDQ